MRDNGYISAIQNSIPSPICSSFFFSFVFVFAFAPCQTCSANVFVFFSLARALKLFIIT